MPAAGSRFDGKNRRQVEAIVQRTRAEQEKRERLLSDENALIDYANDKGVSVGEMRELLFDNHRGNIPILQEGERLLLSMPSDPKPKVSTWKELPPDDAINAEIGRMSVQTAATSQQVATEKQAWEMTREEWRNTDANTRKGITGVYQGEYTRDNPSPRGKSVNNAIDFAHRSRVEKAVNDGVEVPPQVLADYPDLAAKVKPADVPGAQAVTAASKGEASKQEGIAALYAKRMQAKGIGDGTVQEHHQRLEDAINNKSAYALQHLANGMNETAKQVFTEATGVQLPKQQGETWKAIKQWAGVDDLSDEIQEAAKKKEIKYHAIERKYGGDWADTFAQSIQERIDEGATEIVKGADGKHYLVFPGTNRGVPLSAKGFAITRPYVEATLKLRKLKEQSLQQESQGGQEGNRRDSSPVNSPEATEQQSTLQAPPPPLDTKRTPDNLTGVATGEARPLTEQDNDLPSPPTPQQAPQAECSNKATRSGPSLAAIPTESLYSRASSPLPLCLS